MITVFGSINLDLIGKVSRIPKPGETVPGDDFSTAPGGKGANQALALLKAGGVDLSEVKRSKLPQGVAMIFVDQAGENVIGILPGANAEVTIEDAESTLASLGAADVLLVQQEIAPGSTIRALSMARERGARSILNTAPFLPTTPQAAMRADIVVANETEFALLAGNATSPEEWAKAHKKTIIVTLGPDGARAATPDTHFTVPAMKIKPVDTVGAGDTFVGYLAAGLDAGLTLEEAMRRAAVAASLACLKPGAQPSIPQVAEVDAALRSGSR